jgi:hypothetical protein
MDKRRNKTGALCFVILSEGSTASARRAQVAMRVAHRHPLAD